MIQTHFDRDRQAAWYCRQHLQTDPSINTIYYLKDTPVRDICLIEINDRMAEMRDDCLEPLDFGVDRDTALEHRLLVLDVTPGQWEKIKAQQIPLPPGWSMKGSLWMDRQSIGHFSS